MLVCNSLIFIHTFILQIISTTEVRDRILNVAVLWFSYSRAYNLDTINQYIRNCRIIGKWGVEEGNDLI